jgi:hypothetical protein
MGGEFSENDYQEISYNNISATFFLCLLTVQFTRILSKGARKSTNGTELLVQGGIARDIIAI